MLLRGWLNTQVLLRNHFWFILFGADGAEGQLGRVQMQIKVFISSIVEGLFDVVACLGTNLEVRERRFLYLGTNAFLSDLTNIFQI